MKKKKLGTSKGVETLKFVFRVCGIWPKKLPHFVLSMLYNFHFIIILVVFLLLYDLSLIVYIFFLEDVQEITDSLCMSLTLITLFGKVLNFKYFLCKIQNLLHIGEEFDLENEDEISLGDQRISFYKKLIIFLYMSANIAGSSAYVGAFMSSEVRLPFPGWYPFDWQTNHTTYILLYVYQVVGMVIQGNLNVSMDLYSAYLMYVGSIKLEILGKRFEKLGKLQDQCQLSRDSETIREYSSSLVKCIRTYQHIWKYTQQLEKCFTYGFFIQISLIGVVICSTAYQLTITSPLQNIGLYTYMALFLICMITQIALPCYFGNELILKHENLTGSIFKCGWHLQSIQYQRNVIILLELVKKKRKILVGNWFDLDLNLFVSIMNFAYRLYTLLA